MEDYQFAGELSLTGELRPIRGVLAMALAIRSSTSLHCNVGSAALQESDQVAGKFIFAPGAEQALVD